MQGPHQMGAVRRIQGHQQDQECERSQRQEPPAGVGRRDPRVDPWIRIQESQGRQRQKLDDARQRRGRPYGGKD